ncbi:MAG: ATP-binding cassette domain-containing protein [Ammonifex sp.]|nr:MAG: ATP-binding cassette domain-containing protein [Ammonifex sp.]
MTNAIEALTLTRNFKDLVAVNGVSFTVGTGEIFGFLGPNGAGKTTTIKILATLLRPTSGRATVSGYDVVRQAPSVRRAIGMVFQDQSLDDRLTAEENMLFHCVLYGVPRQDALIRMEELLDLVGLSIRRKDLVRTFSGGMKRRLELARGLLHRPAVLFLDEPTLGLDPQTRSHIWDYIRTLHHELGTTVFLTTHYMEEAEVCDRIGIIDHGRIIALDTPSGLKRLVGGDVVMAKTADKEALLTAARERFGLPGKLDDEMVYFETQRGESFIPELIKAVPGILEVRLRQPTLEDVFLKLTGRAIRDTGGGILDAMRVRRTVHQRRRQ